VANPNFLEQSFESCNNSLKASTKFLEDTWKHPEQRLRQVGAVAEGVLVGGAKTVPDRLINHTEETVKQIGAGIAIGALVALAPVEIPIVAMGLAVAGTAMTGSYVWDLGQRLGTNKELHRALDKVWETGDTKALKNATPVIESALGKETFDFGITALTAHQGFKLGGGMKQAANFYGQKMQPGLQAIPIGNAGGCARPNLAITDRMEPYHAMSGRRAEPAAPWWEKNVKTIDSAIEKLSEKGPSTLPDHKTEIETIADHLNGFSNSNERIGAASAEKLISTHKEFSKLIKPVQEHVSQNSKAYDNDLLSERESEIFNKQFELITSIVEKRLSALGFNQPRAATNFDNAFSNHEGLQVQERVSNSISKVLDSTNAYPGSSAVRNAMEESLTGPRLLDWRGVASRPNSNTDRVGADYIIANKSTGEIYPIDVTIQGINLKAASLVESLGGHNGLRWGKYVPKERSEWVICAVDETVFGNRFGGDLAVLQNQEQLQLTRILGKILSKESPLNVLDSQLPISSASQHPTLTLTELLRFSRILEEKNMAEWSGSVLKSAESILMQMKGSDEIPASLRNAIFGK